MMNVTPKAIVFFDIRPGEELLLGVHKLPIGTGEVEVRIWRRGR